MMTRRFLNTCMIAMLPLISGCPVGDTNPNTNTNTNTSDNGGGNNGTTGGVADTNTNTNTDTNGSGGGNNGPMVGTTGFYAADGPAAATPMLYNLDPANANTTAIGAIGFGVNGIAFATDGTLYGVTGGDTPQLITIDTTTGAGTAVGNLTGTVEDISFDDVRNQLLGWQTDANGPDFLVSIDTASGATTRIGTFDSETVGNGLEFGGTTDPVLTDFFPPLLAFTATATTTGPTGTTETTFTYMKVVADFFPAGSFMFGDMMMGNIGNTTALAYHQGLLHVVDGFDAGGARLGSIIPTAGQFVPIGALPDNISGIASNKK